MPWASRVMGDLSGTRVSPMSRIVVDANGKRYRMQDPAPLTPAPDDIQLATESKPWRNYWRMLGTVILAFIVIWFGLTMLVAGGIYGEFILTIIGAFCSIAPLPFLIILHRPKMVHVRLAVPDSGGKTHHPLPEGGSLQTPEPTAFQRFLTPDDSVLDLPPLRQVWGAFLVTVILGVLLSVPLLMSLLSENEDYVVGVFALSFIPVMLLAIAAFSIPVFAWWATSSKILGLPTRRRDAEAWLIAGMASALPALLVNSFVFPALLPAGMSQDTVYALGATISAPIGEEIFKMLGVCMFLPMIRNAKKGFQVGFTVGLGFALIENLTYILGSGLSGAITLTITTVVRGIGSIPAHGLWTGITGFAIGSLAQTQDADKRASWIFRTLSIKTVDIAENLGFDVDGDGDHSGYDDERHTLQEMLAMDDDDRAAWKLIDPVTGMPIETENSQQLEEVGEYMVTAAHAAELRAEDGLRLLPPNVVWACLLISIAGHAFWNGTSVGMEYLAGALSLGMGGTLVLSLIWTAILISVLLFLARGVFKGVRSLPSS